MTTKIHPYVFAGFPNTWTTSKDSIWNRAVYSVCEEFYISDRALFMKTRRHSVVIARTALVAIVTQKTTMNLRQIGEKLNMHHTSIIAMKHRHNNFILHYAAYREAYERAIFKTMKAG